MKSNIVKFCDWVIQNGYTQTEVPVHIMGMFSDYLDAFEHDIKSSLILKITPPLFLFKLRRDKLGLTLREAAKQSGVSASTISRMERNSNCDFNSVQKLDAFYSLSGA
jgi:DNA-binding XRE family transcriptional regulator